MQAETPFDDENAYNRKLDFAKAGGGARRRRRCRRTEVRGAKEHPDGVLVIRDGEMFVEAAEALPNWEATCHAWEVERELRAWLSWRGRNSTTISLRRWRPVRAGRHPRGGQLLSDI